MPIQRLQPADLRRGTRLDWPREEFTDALPDVAVVCGPILNAAMPGFVRYFVYPVPENAPERLTRLEHSRIEAPWQMGLRAVAGCKLMHSLHEGIEAFFAYVAKQAALRRRLCKLELSYSTSLLPCYEEQLAGAFYLPSLSACPARLLPVKNLGNAPECLLRPADDLSKIRDRDPCIGDLRPSDGDREGPDRLSVSTLFCPHSGASGYCGWTRAELPAVPYPGAGHERLPQVFLPAQRPGH